MAFFEAIKSKAKTQSKTVTAGTSATTVVPDSGYDGLSEVTINPTPSQEKTITPSLSSQTVTPDSGKLLSRVTVNAYSPTGNASTSDVLSGKTFMNSNGVQTGAMPNRGAVSGTATASQPYTIPEGYHNGNGVVTASGSYNPTTLQSVATNTGFTAVVGKHYAIALDVGSSAATDVTLTGMTADVLVARLTPSGRRSFFYVGTATATTVTATFVGTTEIGTMYPCQLD